MKMKPINAVIPEEWHEQLNEIARNRSFKEKKFICRNDLIKEALVKTYGLKYVK
jgi:hypothetical protein